MPKQYSKKNKISLYIGITSFTLLLIVLTYITGTLLEFNGFDKKTNRELLPQLLLAISMMLTTLSSYLNYYKKNQDN